MNLTAAQRHMRDLMHQHGLGNWHFEFDRAVKRRGQCNHTDRKITMSRRLTELATEDEAEQTMLHEIAHALVGAGHGHDRVWLAKARSIGYRGHRTSTRQNEVAAPWVGTCPNGHESGKHRRPTRTSSCGRCSRRFDERFIIVWTRRSTVNA